jgi:tRNA (cmo5U34)-methyltransferase
MEIYEEAWAANFEKLAEAGIPGREGLFRLCATSLASLPEQAAVLVVGCGVGSELSYLAPRFPTWRFEAIDPAEPMLAACRRRLEAEGLTTRVNLHRCSLAEFKPTKVFDAATAILVSQHLFADSAAEGFFHQLARLLKPHGALYSADLHLARGQSWELMLDLWQRQAIRAGIPPDRVRDLAARFGRDIALRDEAVIEGFLQRAGFEHILKPFSSLVYGSWSARRESSPREEKR